MFITHIPSVANGVGEAIVSLNNDVKADVKFDIRCVGVGAKGSEVLIIVSIKKW